jgi:hypothetical protein
MKGTPKPPQMDLWISYIFVSFVPTAQPYLMPCRHEQVMHIASVSYIIYRKGNPREMADIDFCIIYWQIFMP